MVGITSYGAHIPVYRLSREVIAKAWDSAPALRGERAVANCDEDSITMAVAAAIDCLNGVDRQKVDGLFFASTTSPYKEKQCSSIIAIAADLRRDIITADFANSLRAGTLAIRAAVDAIKAGSAKSILVVAADCRMGTPTSGAEQTLGDGAAAVLIGDSDVAVSLEDSYYINDEVVDVWRMDDDPFVKEAVVRFARIAGYGKSVPDAVSGVMKKRNLAAKDFTKAVFFASEARVHADVVKRLGFDAKTQAQDPLLNSVGSTGTPQPLMMLVAALEEAKAGDRLLLASYGNGSDAHILEVTNQIDKIRNRRGVKGNLAWRMEMPSYGIYLRFRKLVPTESARRPPEASSNVRMWRTENEALRLYGGKCKKCGLINFPPQRVCVRCMAKDAYDGVRLSDKKGIIYTFEKDFLSASDDPPLVNTIVDLDGGGRGEFQLTDRDAEEVKVGMPVELVFRKIMDAGGFRNYYWKARPIR